MNNEPAFPEHDVNGYDHPGLTKLEYFAGLAMQGLAQSWSFPTGPCRAMNDAAYTAVSMAKALLAALEKESNGK